MAMRDFGLYIFKVPRSFCWLCAVTLVVMLFWGGSQPFAAGLFPVPFDKIAHSVYFGALSLLLWLGTGGRWPVLLFVVVSAIGAMDEFYQATLPGRVADIYDFMFDSAAAGLVLLVLERNKFALNEIQRRTNKT